MKRPAVFIIRHSSADESLPEVTQDISVDRRLSRPKLRHPPAGRANGRGDSRSRCRPTAGDLTAVVAPGRGVGRAAGRVIWVQESTTGWARVQAAARRAGRVPPGQRGADAAAAEGASPQDGQGRHGAAAARVPATASLPLAHQPPAWWRQVRRVVALPREPGERGGRRCATGSIAIWPTRRGRSGPGCGRPRAGGDCRARRRRRPRRDRAGAVGRSWRNWIELERQLAAVEAASWWRSHRECPDAQRLDAVRGHRRGRGGVDRGPDRPGRAVRAVPSS